MGGGGGNFTNPGKFKGMKDWNYKAPDNSGVWCAAVCLVRGIHQNEGNGTAVPKPERRFIQKCLEMQDICGFPEPFYVTLDQFFLFTNVYPAYRVVIYTSSIGRPRIVEGTINYSTLGESYVDKSIYIYRDDRTKHYVYITSVKEFGCSLKNSNNTKFCSSCAWFYMNGQTCSCQENPQSQPRKPKPMITCEHCEEKYYKYIEHKCHYKKCHYCNGVYKDTKLKEHRCPLYCVPNTKEFHETIEGKNIK